MATVTHALVRSRLDCCSALYVGLPLESVRKYQQVQNATGKLLAIAGYKDHATTSPPDWPWVRFQAQFKLLDVLSL